MKAIGTYSPFIKAGETVYMSGQIGMDASTGDLVAGGIAAQAEKMFENMTTVAQAAGGDLACVVKLTVYLLDMQDFQVVNETMERFWQLPYPARACVAVKQLPKGALIEADAILQVKSDG